MSGAALLLLLMSTACDSAVAPQDSAGTLEDPGAVEVVRVLADTSLYPNAGIIEIDLDAYFRQTAGQPLHYTVSSEGVSVSLTTAGERNKLMQIHPLHVGRSRVEVKAADPLDQAKMGSFEVEVLDPCPRKPSESESDYFPIAAGETWRFDFIEADFNANGSRRTIGALVWTIESASTCWAGTQSYSVREQFDGRGQLFRYEINDWEDRETRTWSNTFTIFRRTEVPINNKSGRF